MRSQWMAAALVTLMKQDGCTKVQMTNDKEVYGVYGIKDGQLTRDQTIKAAAQ